LQFPKAPPEALTGFHQVTGQMLLADAMMDTADIAFDIGDQGVDPRQDFEASVPEPGTSH
jgi:hypothetical protein